MTNKARFTVIFTVFVSFLFISSLVIAEEWEWQSPMPTENNLQGVWGISGSDVFAVGDSGSILHYDGSKWMAMSSGATTNLQGVWGTSGSDVFAVGEYGTILHYDGSTWSAMSSGTTQHIFGLCGISSNNVFAVGYTGTILHYDGASWSTMSSGTAQHLYGVWGSSGSDVFAVGHTGTILHYDGASWSAMSSGTTQILYDVSGISGSDVFIAGYNGTILHYDGSSWNSMSSNTAQNLTGVWGDTGNDVFAVGFSGTIFHYDGSSWSAMSSGTTKILRGVWGTSGGDVFAVGENCTIPHFNGSSWSIMNNGTTQHLYGIWGSSDSDVFAMGYNGTILHYDGADWNTMSSGTAQILRGVWGSSSSDVFAVGYSGTILHFNGTNWSAMSSGTTQDLRDVWGSSGSDVFSVGYSGTILHFNGTNWSAMSSSTAQNLQSVWGSSGSDVFAVGLSGTILHYDGSSWSTMSSGTAENFNSVWGSSGSDVFALEHSGMIRHYDGSSWNAMSSGTTEGLNGVWGNSGSDVFAVGTNGAILYFDGTSWNAMSSGTTQQLYGVWGNSGNDVFSVGVGGTILHYSSENINTPENFPDPNFRAAVEIIMGVSSGEVFTATDAAQITSMDVSSKNIASASGIEFFTGLTTFNCSGNQLTGLDISQNTTLTYLNCDFNQISNLNVSHNTLLGTLYCFVNQLTSLDVSQNSALLHFNCGNNQITNIDLSQNIALTHFVCGGNQLTSLDLSSNGNLMNLETQLNQLVSLNVSNNAVLTHLLCHSNQLTSLDVSQNIDLYSLSCSENQLTNMDISQNPDLNYLYCYNNQLTSLDVTNNSNLIKLICDHNHISDISSFVANAGLSAGDVVNIENNDLEQDDWNDVMVLRSRIGVPVFDEWNNLLSGFAYSPQNNHDPYDFTQQGIVLSFQPTNLNVHRSQDIEIAVNISDTSGIIGYRVALDLDPSKVTYVDGSATKVGTSTENGWGPLVVNSVSPALAIFTCASATDALASGPGSLMKFQLHVNDTLADFTPISVTFNALTSLNEDAIAFSTEIWSATVLGPNHQPSFNGGANQVVLEDSGAHEIIGWATDISPGIAYESWQDLNFTLDIDNTSLFFSQPTIDASGALRYTLASDEYGICNATAVLHDSGGTANGGIDSSTPYVFSITVDPVNDAPSFIAGATAVVLNATGGQHTFPGWATSISVGPANESDQSVWFFYVETSNPELFSASPTIDAGGTLRFTPNLNTHGVFDATATLYDSGGVANGGINHSPAQQFVIKIYIPFMWGDLNDNAQAGSVDASLLLQFNAELIDSFPGYPVLDYPEYYPDPMQPWLNFPIAADVNDDDVAGTLDASLVLQKYALLIDWFPADTDHDQWGPDEPLPAGKVSKRQTTRNMNVFFEQQGSSWIVTFQIDNADDVQGLRIDLSYNPEHLQFNGAASGWLVPSGLLAVNDSEPGRLILSGALGTPLQQGQSNLMSVKFDLVGDQTEPLLIQVNEQQTQVNDGQIRINLNYPE